MDPVVKQQASERIRTANEILVTVSANPSVDQLAAAIGTTLLLNKLGKHATAIFSGQTPSTLEFLQPEKTIEHNIDNLRDFIISLDKAKADKLHFKVEDDIVRIYITPYKTSLSEKDLSYSQGDYNIEVILALGVQNRNQVDQALAAHGRILHDATIIAVTAGKGKPSDVGQINWQDPAASSLCEMMMSISESFGSGLIDAQMATAFLTGIVAETERFRNPKTTPKVMTMSAQLMAAGANQQLIASKLELPEPAVPAAPKPAAGPNEGTIKLDHQAEQPAPAKAATPELKTPVSATPAEPKAAPVSVDTDEINIDAEGNVSTLSKPKFIPAPADFQPPPTSLPQVASSATPPADKPLAEDIPLPGEHTLLDPSAHQPMLDEPLSADTQPAWNKPGETPPISAVVGTEEQKQKNAIDEARAAVEAAAAATAAATVPGQTQPAAPSPEAKPEAPPATDDQPAPPSAPPVPPPLPGNVIDAASGSNPPASN